MSFDTYRYGFNMKEMSGWSLSYMINSVMCAKSFADHFNLFFCFVKEEYDISIFDNFKEERACQAWLSYISSIPIEEKENCRSFWPNRCIEAEEVSKKLLIPNFINEGIDYEKYSKMYYNDNRIVSIPNFVSSEVLDSLRNEINSFIFPEYSIVPVDNHWEMKTYNPCDENIKERFDECDFHLLAQNFTYRFKRTFSNHIVNCPCVHCRLHYTVTSYSFTDAICKVVGCKKLSHGEYFLSCYSKNDFLTTHHDNGKGDIAVTIYFTHNWNPNYGGVLHFCDKDKNIYKSISPKEGSLNIFHVSGEEEKDHFVSQVAVNKNRIAFSIWYTILE